MILSKDQLIFLIFLLGATLFGWGGVQTKMIYDMKEPVIELNDALIACGDLDARLVKLEETHDVQ